MMRLNSDVAGGLFLMLIAGAFIAVSTHYQFGTLLRMGPGFFPIVVAGVLGLLGLAIVVAGVRTAPDATDAPPDEPHEPLQLRSTGAVLASVLAFALTLEQVGLVVATFLMVGIAALAETRQRLWRTLAIAVCLSVIAVVIFPLGLRLAVPIFRMPF